MNIKNILLDLGKLLLCGLAYAVGIIIGGMFVNMLGLQPPPMPDGMDGSAAMQFMLLEAPFLALLLALVAHHLSGNLAGRALMLFLVTWVCNTLNNQIEAAAFAGMKTGFLFTVFTFLFPAIFISLAVVWFFPPVDKSVTFMGSLKAYFTAQKWPLAASRLLLGAVSFMPVYYFFGLLVVPFTRTFYDQHLFGLEVPSLDRLLVILFFRSLLFFAAILPVLFAWQGSKMSLFWRLGLLLFYLVGFQSLIMANWMPWALRLPHMIEILLDEFVYAAILVWLVILPRKNYHEI